MTLQFRTSTGEGELKAFYQHNGYVGPLTAFEGNELDGVISLINSLQRERGPERDRNWDRNRHLDIPLIANICRSETIVSCVREVIGPNLVLWRSNIFAISSLERGLRWHQDEYRTLLKCAPGSSQCSVQINFTDSTKLNTVTIMPGSHRWTDDQMRERGFQLRPGTDTDDYGAPQWEIPAEAETLDMPMKAGQFYVFHSKLLHASVRARTSPGDAFVPRLVQLLRAGSETLSGKDLIRYSIAMRIATPDTEILPGAFVESPTRATSVLYAGVDTAAINSLGKWAA